MLTGELAGQTVTLLQEVSVSSQLPSYPVQRKRVKRPPQWQNDDWRRLLPEQFLEGNWLPPSPRSIMCSGNLCFRYPAEALNGKPEGLGRDPDSVTSSLCGLNNFLSQSGSCFLTSKTRRLGVSTAYSSYEDSRKLYM